MHTQQEKEVIVISEKYAHEMKTIAHLFDHAKRVSHYARDISIMEKFDIRSTFLLEVSGLWHDVGLDFVSDRKDHAKKSAEIFHNTFEETDYFTSKEMEIIELVVSFHDNYKEAVSVIHDKKILAMLHILIDADTLELLGEDGYRRAVETASAKNLQPFDTQNPKGETSGFSSEQFDKRFDAQRTGRVAHAIEPTLVGQLNFHISCVDLLYTPTAKQMAKKRVEYLMNKIEETIKN